MRASKYLTAVLLCVLAFALPAAGCGTRETAQGEEPERKTVTITDSTGRIVELQQPLEKVVVLNTDAAEAIRILKVQDRVIGVSDTIQQDPYLDMQDKELIGKWNQPSYEKIVVLKPQAVISYSRTPGPELAEKLEPAGIKVVYLDLYKPETYDSDFRTLAKMFGKEEEAASFINWKEEMTGVLDRIKDIKPDEKPVVFGMWASNFQKEQWKTFASGTSVHQGIEMAGGINAAREMENYPQVSPEWILKQNPSAVVMGVADDDVLGYRAEDFSGAEKLHESIVQHRVFAKTRAAQEKKVYLISTEMLGGDNTYLGALYLAKWFYPDRFKDLDPEQVLKEYFERWLGVPFRGKWAYPPTAK